jgi:hypothetical protein
VPNRKLIELQQVFLQYAASPVPNATWPLSGSEQVRAVKREVDGDDV